MGNGVMPNGLSYRAHPRLYRSRVGANYRFGSKADSDKAPPGRVYELAPSTRPVPDLGRLTLGQLQRLGFGLRLI